MSFQVHQLLDHGFSMLIPASRFEIFASDAAKHLAGTETWVNAEEFGISERVKMRVLRAEVVEDGRAIRLVLEPIPLR